MISSKISSHVTGTITIEYWMNTGVENQGIDILEQRIGLGHNIGHSVGWVERSETQQLIGVGFRSSTQPTGKSYGLNYDQGPKNQKSILPALRFVLHRTVGLLPDLTWLTWSIDTQVYPTTKVERSVSLTQTLL